MDIRDIALMVCVIFIVVMTFSMHEDWKHIRYLQKLNDDLWARIYVPTEKQDGK